MSDDRVCQVMVPIGITYYGRQDRPTHIVVAEDVRKTGKKRTLCSRRAFDIGTPYFGPIEHVDFQRCVAEVERTWWAQNGDQSYARP